MTAVGPACNTSAPVVSQIPHEIFRRIFLLNTSRDIEFWDAIRWVLVTDHDPQPQRRGKRRHVNAMLHWDTLSFGVESYIIKNHSPGLTNLCGVHTREPSNLAGLWLPGLGDFIAPSPCPGSSDVEDRQCSVGGTGSLAQSL